MPTDRVVVTRQVKINSEGDLLPLRHLLVHSTWRVHIHIPVNIAVHLSSMATVPFVLTVVHAVSKMWLEKVPNFV